MADNSEKKVLFKKAILRVNNYLKVTGLSFYNYESKRNAKNLTRRWFFYLNFFFLVFCIASQITWLVKTSLTGALSLMELTFSGPCIILCLLGCVKSFIFLRKYPVTCMLINKLSFLYSNVQVTSHKPEERKKIEFYMRSHIIFLNRALNALMCLGGLGLIAFGIGPILISISLYYTTGEPKLLLPFLLFYPFDASYIFTWPFVYIHQMWSGIMAVFTVFGPDSLFYTLSVFLNFQFYELRQEIESIFNQHDSMVGITHSYADLKKKIAEIVKHHKQLLRCAEFIESIYSETTLCNMLTSSLLICFTGFNVMANIGYILLATPFLAFVFMVIGQIYLLCYYSDLIQRSSIEVSEAVYNCAWYGAKATVVKNLILISTRAQKPCKLTAYGFTDINIRAFTRIMSTSWSYLALLLSLHRNS